MSIEIVETRRGGKWRAGLYTDSGPHGRLFGPEFFDEDEASSFLEWASTHAQIRDVRQLSPEALDHLVGQFLHYVQPIADGPNDSTGDLPDDEDDEIKLGVTPAHEAAQGG